jgi:hypothetical protein
MTYVAPGDWTAYLELADAYRKGSFGELAPDPATAVAMYKLATHASDPVISSAATLRLLECTTTPGPREDVRGTRPNTAYADAAMRETPVPAAAATAAAATAAAAAAAVPAKTLVTNDPQNVHDHAIVASMRQILSSAPPRPSESAYEHVVDLVLTRGSEDAFRTVDSLSSETHSALGISEREALDVVWPEVVRLGAEDILVSQLESGVEHGKVVCSTGKIARILGTLDGLVADRQLRPLWAVREELRGLAIQTRDSGDGKSRFLERAFSEYVDGLGMDATIITKLAGEFSCGFDE